MSKFISLHNHTELGSPLDGMNDVEDLFIRAKEVEHPAIAVTDHGTMTAIYDCWKASKKHNVKLIPGVEIYFTNDLNTKINNHMVLLAKNEKGYRNLLRLNFESYKNQSTGYMGKKTPRISWEHLEKWNEGIICLTACSNGLIAKKLITEQNEAEAICYIQRLNKLFKNHFYLEIQPHNLMSIDKNGREVNQNKLNQAMIRLSHDLDIPYVITCDAHYRDKEHAKYHDFMLAIKDKTYRDDPDRFRYGVQEMYLKTHEEIESFFGKDIATVGMENSIKIMNQCETANYIEPKGPILPTFPVSNQDDYPVFKEWHLKTCPELAEDKSYLRYICLNQLKEEFSDLGIDKKKEYWERFKKELAVLEEKNFSSYMLIVSDFINWAKKNKIPTGPGRGSASGSLIAYLSKITSIDPLKFDLLFERFHNNQKKSFPDIDSDFANPDLVKQYIKEKYGEDKVASISNWNKLSPKVVLKDSARSLLLGGSKSTAFEIANHITSIMPDTKTIEEAYSASKEFAKYMDKYPELYEYACKLQGLTRNWGTHAAGVIIADKPLYEIAPLRIDPDTGDVFSQWEKTRCEDNGLIKMDILGLNTLTTIEKTFEIIKTIKNKDLTLEDIPLDDKDTFKTIATGNTIGVFQLESSLTPLCIKIKPNDIQGISDINALGRPSCSAEQREDYIKRRLKQQPVTFRDPSLKDALGKTYGVSLYEEGMMAIARDCAGWDLNQADNLRKITKLKGKDPELVEKTENAFIADTMKKHNLSYSKAKEIWENEILPFGSYGFNASHSIAYSHISYFTCWLKTHYPTEFMCALLNSEDPNSDKVIEYIYECKKMNINITPPDINTSKNNYTVVKEGEIATGLSAVKGVGEKALNEILSLQKFTSIEDFFRRTNARVINKGIIQSLAKAGVFNSLGRTRKDIYTNYEKYRALAKSYNQIPLCEEEWDRKEILLAEREILGRTISGSLHEIFSGFFTGNSTPLFKLKYLEEGDRVRIEVIINSKIKEFTIKRGKNIGKKFAKYLVEDHNGSTAELTVWQSDYEKYKNILKDGIPIKAICSVGEYMEQKTLSLTTLEGILGK